VCVCVCVCVCEGEESELFHNMILTQKIMYQQDNVTLKDQSLHSNS